MTGLSLVFPKFKIPKLSRTTTGWEGYGRTEYSTQAYRWDDNTAELVLSSISTEFIFQTQTAHLFTGSPWEVTQFHWAWGATVRNSSFDFPNCTMLLLTACHHLQTKKRKRKGLRFVAPLNDYFLGRMQQFFIYSPDYCKALGTDPLSWAWGEPCPCYENKAAYQCVFGVNAPIALFRIFEVRFIISSWLSAQILQQ